ncbi:CHAT domain-containing protein [Tumidithrix elongata RA019]|uniref:CHAT domain-containing protein n=1 Tax=Tumidithrix elongata BACA0141 TaxID=2716417 RepID=A0AAW9PUS4_9CYAN|nr:CHAT domain-containing protein [Tumidithrix elongata RA019]
MIELNVRFASPDRFAIKFDDRETDALEFVAPVNDRDRAEIRWYLESYAAHYMMDVDDRSAERIEAKLPVWGTALFEAIFSGGDAKEIFNNFQDSDERNKILTISASHPLILSLPWELLCDPKRTYLSHGENPISIRRSFSQLTNESEFQQKQVKQGIVPPKNRLHLLFAISRPTSAGFLDPRKDALATLKAIAKNAQGLIDVEFLRPGTLDKLVERLADKSLPSVDIVHFDGHGVFDVNKNIGYLLFEDIGGNGDRVSAAKVGESLSQAGISAMLLSACQSAAVAGEEAMGSVAAGLTHAGIPTVLAMQYSVLTSTTEQMFGAFYEHLMRGQRFGEALENARRYLYSHRERGDRQRGRDRVTLRLQDWFLPALYQVGSDRALFAVEDLPQPSLEKAEQKLSNLGEVQTAGFWGRARELWQIEKAYVRDTRRVTISGFGGIGKTYLAEEVGRWLLRTGMFARVCLVGYANFQGIDAVSYAVSVLATVLDTNLIDAAAVTRALVALPVLVILDNLESLDAGQLASLLDVAKEWSEVGESRVLLTTRTPDLRHPDYPNYPIAIGRRSKHVSWDLEGLQPDDAVNYFQSLLKLPPAPRLDLPFREDLLALFELVQRLPLAIGLLAAQLKDRQVLDVRKELEELLVQSPDNPLLASLNLSINRLDPEAQEWIKRLGVFQGGAFEDYLMTITEIAETEWNELRTQLEASGLMKSEFLSHLGVSVPFLKFHPTLTSAMWLRLNEREQHQLLSHHRQQYYQLSDYLYFEDRRNPFAARTIAQRELPNLLYAVHCSIETDEDFTAEFVDNVSMFLGSFGLNRGRADLTARMQQMGSEVGSQTWFLTQSERGTQLRDVGCYAEAAAVFEEILASLGANPSYDRCVTLFRLGQCYWLTSHLERALATYHLAFEVVELLEQTNSVKRQIGILQAGLADVLTAMGDYDHARESYEASLDIFQEQNDYRHIAVVQAQLGTLATKQNNNPEAIQRYQEALEIFHQLNEPAMEANSWHLLGNTLYESNQLESAEWSYRQSVQINEAIGNLVNAAMIWNQLAIMCKDAGRLMEAEEWCRKAINGFRDSGNGTMADKALENLANLLQRFPNRLNEAKQLAEESLAIKETLDPAVAQIWNIYALLAQISDQQGDPAQAKEYRCLSRSAAGTKYKLRQSAQQFIDSVVRSFHDAEIRQQLESQMQSALPEWQNLIVAIRQIFNGQRDEDILCEKLGVEDSQIVLAILHGIAAPETLKAFMPTPDE